MCVDNGRTMGAGEGVEIDTTHPSLQGSNESCCSILRVNHV